MGCYLCKEHKLPDVRITARVEENHELEGTSIDMLSDSLHNLDDELRNENDKLGGSNDEVLQHHLDICATEHSRRDQEISALQRSLWEKSQTMDQQVLRIQKDMELHLENETARLMEEFQMKEKKMHQDFVNALSEKDEQLQEVLAFYQQMSQKLESLHENEKSLQGRVDLLSRDKIRLEQEVASFQKRESQVRTELSQLKQSTKIEEFHQERNHHYISKRIALEKEELSKQLHLLRAMNAILRDEEDAFLNSVD